MERRWRRPLRTAANHHDPLGSARACADVQQPSADGGAWRLDTERLGIDQGPAHLSTGSTQGDTADGVNSRQESLSDRRAVQAREQSPAMRRATLVLLVGGALVALLGLAAGMRGWPAFGNSPLGQVSAVNGGYLTVLCPGTYAIDYTNTSAAATVPAAQVVGPGYQVASVTTRRSDRHPPDSPTSHWVGEFTAPVSGRYRIETGGFAVADGTFVVREVTGPNTVLEEAAGGVGLLMVAAGVLLFIKRQRTYGTETNSRRPANS